MEKAYYIVKDGPFREAISAKDDERQAQTEKQFALLKVVASEIGCDSQIALFDRGIVKGLVFEEPPVIEGMGWKKIEGGTAWWPKQNTKVGIALGKRFKEINKKIELEDALPKNDVPAFGMQVTGGRWYDTSCFFLDIEHEAAGSNGTLMLRVPFDETKAEGPDIPEDIKSVLERMKPVDAYKLFDESEDNVKKFNEANEAEKAKEEEEPDKTVPLLKPDMLTEGYAPPERNPVDEKL